MRELLFIVVAWPFAPAPADEVDAGVAKAPLARWEAYDGGALRDGGVSDVVELEVGATVKVKLPPVELTVCDDPFVEVGGEGEHLTLTGSAPGTTACGFWLVWPKAKPGQAVRPFPDRLFEITVREPAREP